MRSWLTLSRNEKEKAMQIEFEQRIIVQEFDTDEDGNITNCHIKGLECIEMGNDVAYFDIPAGYWCIYEVDGIGQYVQGIGVESVNENGQWIDRLYDDRPPREPPTETKTEASLALTPADAHTQRTKESPKATFTEEEKYYRRYQEIIDATIDVMEEEYGATETLRLLELRDKKLNTCKITNKELNSENYNP